MFDCILFVSSESNHKQVNSKVRPHVEIGFFKKRNEYKALVMVWMLD